MFDAGHFAESDALTGATMCPGCKTERTGETDLSRYTTRREPAGCSITSVASGSALKVYGCPDRGVQGIDTPCLTIEFAFDEGIALIPCPSPANRIAEMAMNIVQSSHI